MKYVFITGIPTAGKSYLAKKISEKTGCLHIDIDKWREEMAKDPKLERWVNFYWNVDEEKYLLEKTCDERWSDLTKQSETFWPTIENKIKEIVKSNKPAIFEGVNVLPHLAIKSFDFPGFCILGNSFEEIFERNKQSPRWGNTEKLQRMEAKDFFNCERLKYKAEAEKFGFKVYEDPNDAEEEILTILQ
ncbi:hypothetical protein BH10PAT1_BH10PAT1_7330 [soil metagenome]